MYISKKIKPLYLLAYLTTASLSALSEQNLPPPYDTAEILPFEPNGYFGIANRNQLEDLIKTHNIKTVIEVGSFFGDSTRHLAHCIPEGGVVYAVDHWKGSLEHQKGQDGWFQQIELLYEYFLSNTIQAGLTHKIIPVKMESLEAASMPVMMPFRYMRI